MRDTGRSNQCGVIRCMRQYFPFSANLPSPNRLQKEPDGVITVKFRDPISAQACVVVRFFIVSRATYVAYVEPPQKCRKCKVAFFPDAKLKHRCGSAGNISGVAVSQRTSRKSGGKKVKRSDWTPLPTGCLRKATELV